MACGAGLIHLLLRTRWARGNRRAAFATETICLLLFASGGGLIQTGAHSAPNLSSPGQGVWRHIVDLRYAAVLRFFRFNPDGTVAETRKVTRLLELCPDGNRFTGTASVEVFDAEDSLIMAHCATEVGKRFE